MDDIFRAFIYFAKVILWPAIIVCLCIGVSSIFSAAETKTVQSSVLKTQTMCQAECRVDSFPSPHWHECGAFTYPALLSSCTITERESVQIAAPSSTHRAEWFEAAAFERPLKAGDTVTMSQTGHRLALHTPIWRILAWITGPFILAALLIFLAHQMSIHQISKRPTS